MGGYVQDARWYGLRNIMASSRARCKITLLARSLVLKIDRSIATHAARPHCRCKAQGCVIPWPLLGPCKCPDLAHPGSFAAVFDGRLRLQSGFSEVAQARVFGVHVLSYVASCIDRMCSKASLNSGCGARHMV